MVHLYTFIVTTMEIAPYQMLQFYCGQGEMENYIKEGKSGFGFVPRSSSFKMVDANRLMVHALAYNLFNSSLCGFHCEHAEAADRYHSVKADEDCRE